MGERANLRRYTELTAVERSRLGRWLRLRWACGGDVEQAAAADRVIEQGAAIDRRRHGRSPLQ